MNAQKNRNFLVRAGSVLTQSSGYQLDTDSSIEEPYAEHGDYLDKDDFSNLLNVLGRFTGKATSGLLSFSENILNEFIFKNNKKSQSEGKQEQE